MIDALIRWILSLFGINKNVTNTAQAALQAAGGSADAHREQLGRHIKGLEHIEGAEHIRVVEGNAVRTEQGAALMHDPDDGSYHWTSTWNRAVPPAQWQDEWGPVSKDDFDTFWWHKTEFDMLHAGDAEEAERKVQSFGYRDMGHFFQVEHTFLKYYGHPHSPGAVNLEDFMWDQERVSKAAMAGMMKMQEAKSAAALAANPELLAPVEGVDLDTYAKLAAASATGTTPEQFNAMLAQHGIDMAKWQRVNSTWTDRMAKDTTQAITTAYAKAFANAGSGQFGGAAQAAGQVMGTTGEAGGSEPVPFEKLCEIQGAMTAWSKTGQDVNAMLKHTFGITAGDWSNISMWWMTKMMNDLSLMTRYNEEAERYEAQYSAGAPAAADSDLTF